jgi:hypothetical protein
MITSSRASHRVVVGASRRAAPSLLALLLTATTTLTAQRPPASSIAADETVVLFPTWACRPAGRDDAWRVAVAGQVFEPETDSELRAGLVEAAIASLDAIGLEPAGRARARARERLAAFVVDDESRERIVVAVGDTRAEMPRSSLDGSFAGELLVTGDDARALGGTLTLRVVLQDGDVRAMSTVVHCHEPEGVLIVSDIDDTVRIGTGDDARSRLRDAIVAEYRAVPGMAAAYRALVEDGAACAWLTAAPWPLHGPYAEFLRSEGFPAGSLRMRAIPLGRPDWLAALAQPTRHKRRALDELLATFPDRRFVLIGDTIEDDPEIFADVALAHGDRVLAILLREDPARPPDVERLARCFARISRAKHATFREADELAHRIAAARRDGAP